jgi:copper chaperone CopZ
MKGKREIPTLTAKMSSGRFIVPRSILSFLLSATVIIAFGKVSEAGSGHEQLRVIIMGMTCQFSVYGVEQHLKMLPGVKSVRIDLSQSRATIDLDQGAELDPEDLAHAVSEAGFTPGAIVKVSPSFAAHPRRSRRAADVPVTSRLCLPQAPVLEQSLEGLARAMQSDLHGIRAYAKHLGGFGSIEVFDVPQDDDGTVLTRQPIDRFSHCLAHFLVVDRLLQIK